MFIFFPFFFHNINIDSEPENDHFYSTLFGYLLPMGFLFIPLIDGAVEKSMTFALHTTNGLAITFSSLMLIPNLNIQIINFLMFAGYRAFLYGVMGAFIGDTFGPITLGRITGCVFTTGSLVNLIQAPIINSVNNAPFYGDTTVLSVGLLLIGFALIIPISLSPMSSNDEDDEIITNVKTSSPPSYKSQGEYVKVDINSTV